MGSARGVSMICPLCDGPVFYIGTLGGLDHFKCRNCGIEFSTDAIDWEGGEDE